MEALYRFHQDAGRMGSLDGLFIADRASVEKLYGKDVYFGEVLGKHSDVECPITKANLTEKSADPILIEGLRLAIGSDSLSGLNPFDYIEEFEEAEDCE